MPLANKNKPSERPPLMVCYYGTGGTGKTTSGMTYPDPLVIDGEAGTRNYLNMFTGAVRDTKSYGELLRLVREYKSKGKCTWKEGSETIEYIPKSIVIDPVTAFYESIQAAKFMSGMDSQGITVSTGIERPKNDKDTFQAWGAIKTHWKILMSELQSSGLNFICCAHEKEEMKSEQGPKGMEVVKTGRVIADTEKSYHYVFDLILRLMFDEIKNKRYAIVMKSRLKDSEGKDRFQMGQRLDQWDYDFLIEGMSPNIKTRSTQSEAEAIGKDSVEVEKNPEASRLAHELRSRLLPKYEIKNEDFELYLLNKTLKDGKTHICSKGEDGKVHISSISPDVLRFLIKAIESDESRKTLLSRIEELKNQIPGLELVK